METSEIGHTSLQLAPDKGSGPLLHKSVLNRMDVRFLLNGPPPLTVGFTHRAPRRDPQQHAGGQWESVGRTVRASDKSVYGRARLKPAKAQLLAAGLSGALPPPPSPPPPAPVITSVTAVVRGFPHDARQVGASCYYVRGDGLPKPIKHLRAVPGPSAARSSCAKRKTFPCEQCGFLFGMRSNLKRHVHTVHEDRRTFACWICGSAFGLKQNLATHIRVKHEKQRPFKCDICSQTFGYKQVLQNHRRNIHHSRTTKL